MESKDKRQGWLANLKVGDLVIVDCPVIDHGSSISRIKKILSSGEIVTDACIYQEDEFFSPRGEQGCEIFGNTLREATPEAVQKIELDRKRLNASFIVRKVIETCFVREAISDEDLFAVATILGKYCKKEESRG